MPKPTSKRNRSFLLVPLILLMACGDDTPPPPVGDTGANRRDTGNSEDTGSPDTGDNEDANVDTGPADAGDSEVPCTAEVFELARDPIFRNRPVSVSATDRGFYFAWGDAQDVREQARAAELAEGAVEPMLRVLTDDDNSERSVVVADGFVIWLDDGATGEHRTVRGKNTSSTTADPRLLSGATGIYASPWLIRGDNDWTAGWAHQVGSHWLVETRTFDADGEQRTQALPWELPTGEVAIDFAEGNYYVAWVGDGNVWLAIADAAGAEVRAPAVVSNTNNAVEGELGVAFANGFGVVAFSVTVGIRQEVRARLFESSGEPVRTERVVSRPPMEGRAPSVIAYAGGYAVAFRARTTENEFLQVGFIHGSEGTVVAEYNLGDSLFEGARPGLAVEESGGLGVGWAGDVVTSDARQTVIHGGRLACGAAWLRCGVMP